ncbi:MAG: choice-of-anchor J domain-containing protein, partial [Bacteroidales bacterium]|nr:choice-of-anchor J domain-containing protein [Candidatus Colimorpha onthohippi]
SYAMRIDPQNLRENTCLVSAMVFDISAGSHTLKVYQGENPSSAQLLATKSFTLSGDSVWRSVTFADSIPITTTQPLWLVVSAANAAVPCASYAGFDDGSWLLNADGQWQTVTDQDYYLTWMLRGVFARRNSQAQCHITQFPYLQDFEYDMSCWTSAVADRSSANLLGMGVLEAGSQAYSADYVYQFCSYFSSNDYRQYLISPQLSASGDINLTFYCWAPYGLYYAEQFRVLYSTESNAVEDFVYQVADVTIRSSSWHKCNFTIPATARYIAIQYYSQYKYYLMVDDIQLTTAAPNILSQLCQIDTLPWVENFYDSDTKACWQSVDNDRDGYDWMLETYPNLDLGVVFSESYVNRKGALQPDNWLISPSIVLPAGHSYKLSWYAAGVDDNDYAEHYSVYLSTQGYGMPQLISNPIFSQTITRPDWEYHEVDLSPYAGDTIVLNFRHHNCSNQYRLWITDVSIQSTDDTLAVIAPQTDGNHYPLIVAPNPATDVVTIYTQGFQSAQLFDLHARCRLVSNSESFSTAHLPRGVYMLRVTTQYGVQIRKVILTSH